MRKRFVIKASNNYCTAADWDACWAAYDKLVSTGEINNMDYDELVDAVSEMADVPSRVTYTIVDEFIANEDDRIRLAYASTRNRRSSVIRASRRSNRQSSIQRPLRRRSIKASTSSDVEDYIWDVIGQIRGAGIFKVSLANTEDEVIIDFERTRDYQRIEDEAISAFVNEGYRNTYVVYNTGTEIVLHVPGLER